MNEYSRRYIIFSGLIYRYKYIISRMFKISVLIPVYNEFVFVKNDLESLLTWLDKNYAKQYELVIVENGSTDGTLEALHAAAKTHKQLKIYSLAEPSFGNAVRTAILNATGEIGILLNADWIDTNFIKAGALHCKTHDVVIGSKLLDPTLDSRPVVRKIASKSLTFLLQKIFKFEFSDSHGLKAFRLSKIKPIAKKCTLNEIFESELLLRAQYASLKITEIPVAIIETRSPRTSFFGRIFSMFRELFTLHKISKKINK